jgi:hypothetical protein
MAKKDKYSVARNASKTGKGSTRNLGKTPVRGNYHTPSNRIPTIKSTNKR